MEITGKIKQIGETKTFGAKGFKKREFVVITDEKYPQHIPMETVQDKCELLDKYQVGQDVVVSVNVQGREWTNPQGELKHFLSLQAWRISTVEGIDVEAEQISPQQDDLPF